MGSSKSKDVVTFVKYYYYMYNANYKTYITTDKDKLNLPSARSIGEDYEKHTFSYKSKNIEKYRYAFYTKVKFVSDVALNVGKISNEILFDYLIIDTLNYNFLILDNELNILYLLTSDAVKKDSSKCIIGPNIEEQKLKESGFFDVINHIKNKLKLKENGSGSNTGLNSQKEYPIYGQVLEKPYVQPQIQPSCPPYAEPFRYAEPLRYEGAPNQ
jgi:hypothetical protein